MPAKPAQTRYGPPDGNAELRDYSNLVAATFGADAEMIGNWLRTLGARNLRVLRRGDSLDAGLSIYEMAQYFGGKSVPIWGLAGVVLPPSRRGKGVGRELLLANLREQFEVGPPVAALYPASTHVYRALGYEQAGSRVTARIRPLELPPARAEAECRPLEAADWPEVRRVYAQARGGDTGCLDRSSEIWERIRRVSPGTQLQGTLIEHKGEAEGYLIYTLSRKDGALRLNMNLRDWAFTTPRARQTLLNQLYVQRSVVQDITMQIGPADPLLHGTVHDQNAHVLEYFVWMLRIVRAQDALTARGWPAIEATFDFELIDEHLAENNGPWRVRISAGQPGVKRIKSASCKLHTRGLAALYSGFMQPGALRRAGLLEGSNKHDAAMAAAFAGPAPYTLDYF